MDTFKTGWAAAPVLAAVFAVTNPVDARPLTARIVLHLSDFAGVSAGDLAVAKREVEQVYREAGVELVWVAGTNETDEEPAVHTHLRIAILDAVMLAQKARLDTVVPGAAGQASRRTGYAYIFFSRVEELACTYRVDRGRLLGRVIAHELGHLVLPENSHTLTGIMSKEMSVSTGLLRFSSGQAATIRVGLAGPN